MGDKRNRQENAKEQQEKRVKLTKKNAVEKSKTSNYFNKIQKEATTNDTDSHNTPAEEIKISWNESESNNKDEEKEPCSLPKCQIKHYLTKSLIGQPVNYAMIGGTYFALMVRITASKTLLVKNV